MFISQGNLAHWIAERMLTRVVVRIAHVEAVVQFGVAEVTPELDHKYDFGVHIWVWVSEEFSALESARALEARYHHPLDHYRQHPVRKHEPEVGRLSELRYFDSDEFRQAGAGEALTDRWRRLYFVRPWMRDDEVVAIGAHGFNHSYAYGAREHLVRMHALLGQRLLEAMEQHERSAPECVLLRTMLTRLGAAINAQQLKVSLAREVLMAAVAH